MDIEPKTVSVKHLLSVVRDVLIALAEKKGLSILLDIPDNLPSVESDEMRMHQIFLNIVGNAIKFTEEGTIKISASSVNNNIIIKVEDSGIGIPEEMLPYIFDEFRQVDGSSSRQYEGTGLGLAIASKLTKILGGNIEATSILDVGTTFTVSIPIKWHSKTLISNKTTPQKILKKANTKTILVVEDNANVAQEIARYLSEGGFETQIARTAAEARSLACNYPFYAITLDIYLGEDDGWGLLQEFKNNPQIKDIPVIVVTISTDKTTGFALGALGYVSKPIIKESLLLEIYNIDKKPRSILIIDDNEIELNQMAEMVKIEDITPIIAKGGREGLELLKKEHADLLILDLMMPEVNGFEVLHELRKNRKTQYMPVIVVTAKHLSAKDKALLNGQVSAVIAKNETTVSELNAEIKKILKNIEVSHKIGKPYNNKGIRLLPTLLIVEDNLDNMTTFKVLLNQNYNIIEAYDGEEGVKCANENLPDLILLDMSLPKLDGIKVVKILKENDITANIPVVAVSAQVMKGDKERFLAAGCDDFVPKPIDANDLIEKIETWILE